MEELVIKVPAPFYATDEIGFSTRYPEQRIDEPLRDVALFIEGNPDLIARLSPRLEGFPLSSRRAAQGYTWTDPVMLSDELLVMGYRDRSQEISEPAESAHRYFVNLMQPVVLPFLRDCVRVANLRLADRIELRMMRGEEILADFALHLDQVLPSNGTLSLRAA
ncbi:MAG: hypothetical protein NVSMB17_02790 [Candidatus Dormibacteria bacterium]